MTSTVHVIPTNDLKGHEEGDDCDCLPAVKYVGGGGKVVVHNSWDGREFYEAWEADKTGKEN